MTNDYMTPEEALEAAAGWAGNQLNLSGMRRNLPQDPAAWRPRTQVPPELMEQSGAPALPGPAPEGSPFSLGGITKMVDLKRLSGDFDAASKGDAAAKARVVSLGPGFAESQKTPPRPSVMNLPQARDIEGMVTRDLPEAREVGPQEAQPLHPDSGGSGVEVQDQESGRNPFDLGKAADTLSVGLTDIGNILGNARAPIHTASYEAASERLRTSQIDQLRRRQSMWDDAYKQSQALPQEVLADPETFGGLISAKQALDKDMMDGKIDNEKNVSLFLTEMARSKSDIQGLVQQSQLKQQMAAEDAQAEHRAGLTDLYGPTPGQRWEREQEQDVESARRFNVQDERLREQAEQQNQRYRDVAGIQAGERRDNRESIEASKRSNAIRQLVGSSVQRYAKVDPESGAALNPQEALAAGLAENEPGIVELARKAGVNFRSPGEAQDPQTGEPIDVYVIQGRVFDASNPQETAQALQLLLSLSSF